MTVKGSLGDTRDGGSPVDGPVVDTSEKVAPKRRARVAAKPEQPAAVEPTKLITSSGRRGRSTRPFPAGPFDEALDFAREIFNFASGQTVRRLSLFDHLKRTPDSSTSRQLVTNANKYGLIKGNYQSDQLELTVEGRRVCDDATNQRDTARLKATLAIKNIPPFEAVYERFVNAKLPVRAALIDSLKEAGVEAEYLEEAADTFIVNLKSVGLLQTLSGADRVVSIDHLLDALPVNQGRSLNLSSDVHSTPPQGLITQEQASFETTCFYITPIGSEDSVTRKHSDLFLSSIVEPAIQTVGLSVVRADRIDKPGVITRQIIEYILRSRLVVADLSLSNANVFYELALRHAIRLPIVQIVQHGDPIPFDVNQMRTIVIDNRDMFTLFARIEAHKSEIASQARRALDAGSEVDTPISIYFPQVRFSIGP